MRKVLIIAFVFCLFSAHLPAQIKTLSGSIGYNQQYNEDSFGNTLWISRTRTPSVDLSVSGMLLSEDLAEFELQSFFTQSSMSSRGSAIPLDFSTQSWTLYRFSLSVLQYSPLWILYTDRAGYVKTSVDAGIQGAQIGKTRSRDQALALSLRKISFLPPITVGYNRSRGWADDGPGPGTLSQSYTFSSSASNGSTTMNLTGQTTLLQNDQNSIQSKSSAIRFDGTKSLSDSHTLNLESEYNWYDQFALMRAGLLYRGNLENRTNLGGGITFSQTTTALTLTTIYSANANAGHAIDEHWRYNIGVGDEYSSQVLTHSGGFRPTPYNSWRTNIGLSQMQNLGGGSFSSSLSLGGGWTSNEDNSSTYSGAMSASYTKGFGTTRFTANGGTNVSYDQRLGKYQTRIGNRLDCTVDSRLYSSVSSTSRLAYTDNISQGTFLGGYLNRSISAGEAMRGNFNYLIPFSLSASFSSSWYFGDLKGTTYGWSVDFISGRFFTDRLSFSYQYNRYYEIFYHNASTNHSVQLQYPWRMFSLSLSAYQRTSYSRQRGLNFSISRSF